MAQTPLSGNCLDPKLYFGTLMSEQLHCLCFRGIGREKGEGAGGGMQKEHPNRTCPPIRVMSSTQAEGML
jgi:hypothetical protein